MIKMKMLTGASLFKVKELYKAWVTKKTTQIFRVTKTQGCKWNKGIVTLFKLFKIPLAAIIFKLLKREEDRRSTVL